METQLFLAPYEVMLFEQLPEPLREAWRENVSLETLDAFESAEELEKRMTEGGYDESPTMKAFVEKLASGNLDAVTADDFPEDQLPNLLYNIGAGGISAIMMNLLSEQTLDDKDMSGLAALSRARHQMLQLNTVLA